MDCRDVADRVYEYLGCGLSGEEIAELNSHLRGCGSCLELVRFESGVIKLVKRDCGSERAPAELHNRLLRIVRS